MRNLLFGNYTQDSLVGDESIVCETTRHWINFFNYPLLFVLVIVSLITFNFYLISIVLGVNFLHLYIIISTDECVVTSKRVIFKSGILFTNTIEMNLTKIESLSIQQSLLGKLLDYGTIQIRGTGGTIETFLNVNKPLEIRKKIQQYSF